MEIVNGSGNKTIAGCKTGDTILIHLITGKVEKVFLVDFTKIGVEGLMVDLKTQPLTFYPFTSILKLIKYSDIS